MIEDSKNIWSNGQHPAEGAIFLDENQKALATLLSKLQKGNIQAFETIFQAYQTKLLNFVRLSLNENADAEEIVQDIFLKIWEKRADIDLQKNFSSFLYTIAKNGINDHLRKSLNRKKYLNAVLTDAFTAYNDVELAVEFQETERIINQLVDELPEKRKQVFLLSRLHGKTYRQIAEELKISENTVDTQIRKAISSIKGRWQEINGFITTLIALFMGV